jgi:hypothetical protein
LSIDLDKSAELLGLCRKPGETDAELRMRARIYLEGMQRFYPEPELEEVVF